MDFVRELLGRDLMGVIQEYMEPWLQWNLTSIIELKAKDTKTTRDQKTQVEISPTDIMIHNPSIQWQSNFWISRWLECEGGSFISLMNKHPLGFCKSGLQWSFQVSTAENLRIDPCSILFGLFFPTSNSKENQCPSSLEVRFNLPREVFFNQKAAFGMFFNLNENKNHWDTHVHFRTISLRPTNGTSDDSNPLQIIQVACTQDGKPVAEYHWRSLLLQPDLTQKELYPFMLPGQQAPLLLDYQDPVSLEAHRVKPDYLDTSRTGYAISLQDLQQARPTIRVRDDKTFLRINFSSGTCGASF
jgi:hypothetical protein